MKTKTIGVIQLKRYPYEEPYCLNIVVSATNGLFDGSLEFYCDTDDLINLGNALRVFPKKAPDEYFFELGSNKPEDNYAYYFAIHAYTTDRSGHSALQIVLDNNKSRPDEGSCCFSIKAEPSAINRLGELLLIFSNLEHLELNWSLSGEADCLIGEDK